MYSPEQTHSPTRRQAGFYQSTYRAVGRVGIVDEAMTTLLRSWDELARSYSLSFFVENPPRVDYLPWLSVERDAVTRRMPKAEHAKTMEQELYDNPGLDVVTAGLTFPAPATSFMRSNSKARTEISLGVYLGMVPSQHYAEGDAITGEYYLARRSYGDGNPAQRPRGIDLKMGRLVSRWLLAHRGPDAADDAVRSFLSAAEGEFKQGQSPLSSVRLEEIQSIVNYKPSHFRESY